jgi:hypothetical protein
MATITEKRFAQYAITASDATAFTSHASNRTIILTIILANTSAAVVKVKLGLGATYATTNSICPEVAILPNSRHVIKGPIVMGLSENFRALADATGVTATISGYEAS